jgi:transposase-like protein
MEVSKMKNLELESKPKSKYKPRIKYMTEKEFDQKFPDEKAAVDYFIKVRYGDNIVCRHCGKPITYRYGDRLKAFHCYSCRNSFSPFKDTIFQKTHLGLLVWYAAIRHIINNRKGIAACTIERELGVSTATAWRMLQQIRIAMSNSEIPVFEGTVEIDETLVGGKPRNQNAWVLPDGTLVPRPYPKKKNKRGMGSDKTVVVGVKERSTGRVYAKVILKLKGEKGGRLTTEQLVGVLEKVTKEGSTVMTDGNTAYSCLSNEDSKYKHFKVIHSKGEYVNFQNPEIHTNGIESIWAILKRAHYGIYHHYSVKYSQRYVNEVSFRQGNCKNLQTFDELLKQCILFNPSVITDTVLEIMEEEAA